MARAVLRQHDPRACGCATSIGQLLCAGKECLAWVSSTAPCRMACIEHCTLPAQWGACCSAPLGLCRRLSAAVWHARQALRCRTAAMQSAPLFGVCRVETQRGAPGATNETFVQLVLFTRRYSAGCGAAWRPRCRYLGFLVKVACHLRLTRMICIFFCRCCPWRPHWPLHSLPRRMHKALAS